VRGRAHSEQIDHHQFAVVVPFAGEEAELGCPAHREQRGVFGDPGPVDAIEDGVGEVDDVLILKVLAAGEDAAEQDGGVDGGDFGVPDAFAGVDVGEVKEEAAMGGELSPEEDESVDDAETGVLVRDVTALFRDADGREAEAGGGDAGDYAGVVDADVAAIFDQAGLGIGLFPEEEEAATFELFEKLIVFGGERGRGRRWFISPPRGLLRGCMCPGGESFPRGERQSEGGAGYLSKQASP